jgi:hypothetical protein
MDLIITGAISNRYNKDLQQAWERIKRTGTKGPGIFLQIHACHEPINNDDLRPYGYYAPALEHDLSGDRSTAFEMARGMICPITDEARKRTNAEHATAISNFVKIEILEGREIRRSLIALDRLEHEVGQNANSSMGDDFHDYQIYRLQGQSTAFGAPVSMLGSRTGLPGIDMLIKAIPQSAIYIALLPTIFKGIDSPNQNGEARIIGYTN